MSKELLVNTFNSMKEHPYNWTLYFFKVDKRKTNPYMVYKIRFKNDDYLPQYAQSLSDMMLNHQLNKIDDVKDYTGENTKISCDKIKVENELIKEQWDCLVADVAEPSDEKIKGKYHGYILEGSLHNESIVLVKMANPIINLKNKRSIVFSFDDDNELAEFSDEVCKLYMDVDFLVIDNTLYSFNYKFEDMFNIQKTMQRVKYRAIEEISEIDAFSDRNKFRNFAKAYKSPRTFLTLNPERVDRIKQKTKRKHISEMLKISLDSSKKFDLQNEEEAFFLIKYLCFKLFKDEETKDLLEANNVSKVDLS